MVFAIICTILNLFLAIYLGRKVKRSAAYVYALLVFTLSILNFFTVPVAELQSSLLEFFGAKLYNAIAFAVESLLLVGLSPMIVVEMVVILVALGVLFAYAIQFIEYVTTIRNYTPHVRHKNVYQVKRAPSAPLLLEKKYQVFCELLC